VATPIESNNRAIISRCNTRPADETHWLSLDGYYNWQEPTPLGEEKYASSRRNLWYILKSYVIRKADAQDFLEWAKRQNFMGRWMPEANHLLEIFLGELYWAPSYIDETPSNEIQNPWARLDSHDMPAEVVIPTHEYLWEDSGFDCSVEDTIDMKLPSKWLKDQMVLSWNSIESNYVDNKGAVIAFDPSVKNIGPSTLLIDRDEFISFLEKNEYTVVWTLLGEKMVVGGDESPKAWLRINGAFSTENRALIGEVTTEYEFRDDAPKYFEPEENQQA
jgi:hypothetical protein